MRTFILALILFAAQAASATTVWITTTTLPNGTVGTAYSAYVYASGGCTPYKWWVSSGALPAGLTGTPSSTTTNLHLAGVPSAAMTDTFSVSVKGCGGHVSTKSYSVVIAAAPAPNFSISASPSSLSVTQGTSGNSAITTTASNGFNSAVALSASGQPSGVTVSFSPNPIAAPGSSTMTMTVAASVATGTYTITATGTGGGVTHAATVSLTVTAATIAHVVDLSWAASTSTNVVGYNMYRAPVGGSFAKINSGGLIASTLFTDMNVVSGASYNYVATAVDNTGIESSYSNQIAVTIPSP